MVSIPDRLVSKFSVALHLVLACTLMFTPLLPAHAAVSSWQQKGINLYPTSPTDFGSTNYQAAVNHFKSLGMNTLTLIIQLYQSNTNSTDIGPGGNTPTDASLVSAIQYAHAQGMQVMLNIHLDTQDGNWRALINPGDRATWYAHYLSQLQHYAQLGQSNGVEMFCVGTELIDMSSAAVNSDNTQQWQNMIAQVRKVFSGKLTYDANWGGTPTYDEVRGVQFWSALDFIGISAYYTLPGDGSVSSDQSAWANWQANEIGPIQQQWGKPVLFTEIGYRSVSDAHNAPYESGTSGPYDAQEQVNDYQALLSFWNNYSYMQGIDIWYGNSNLNAGGQGDTDYLIQNKPAENTIKTWFGGSGTTPPVGPPAAFSVTGSASPAQPTSGQSVTLSANVSDTGGAAYGDIIDFEVYNGSQRVFQKTFESQDFTANQTKPYSANWIPSANGTYSFKVGVFDSNWKLQTWNDSVAQVGVGTGGSSGGSGGSNPPPPPTGSVIDLWWPSNGATVSGVQPFKALLENTALSSYAMYWQVDGGQLNLMNDSQTDYPHKEADVNLSSWTWKGSGPYTLTFTAKGTNGSTLAQKSSSISVSH